MINYFIKVPSSFHPHALPTSNRRLSLAGFPPDHTTASTVPGITSRRYLPCAAAEEGYLFLFCKCEKTFPRCSHRTHNLSSQSLCIHNFITDVPSHVFGLSWVTNLPLIQSLTKRSGITMIGLASHTGHRVLFPEGWISEQH